MAKLGFSLMLLPLILMAHLNAGPYLVSGQLTLGYYAFTCPTLEAIVFSGMYAAVQQEARLAASILRLLFHDCFVQVNPSEDHTLY